MPELPDVTLYIEHLTRRLAGTTLLSTNVVSPNLLRTAEPPLEAAHGRRVLGLRRIGKRVVIELEGGLFLVFHLMIAGRFTWRDPEQVAAKRSRERATNGHGTKPRLGRIGLAQFEFPSGTLVLTEAGTRKRASLHVVEGEEALAALDPGGIDLMSASPAEFSAAIRGQRHTLKRALTDPRILSGVGNAYSDEILHRARLSPFKLTDQITEDEMARLRRASLEVLREWTERLRAEAGDAFPTNVTAFHQGMAVHGRYKKPCPVCGAPVQRVVYAENEMNYCARCQTEGRLLADRSLSRLLRSDWPKRLEDLER